MTTYFFLIAAHLGTQKHMLFMFPSPDECLEARNKIIATVPVAESKNIVVECVAASPLAPKEV